MTTTPDPTAFTMTCLECLNWQVDAPPRARASLGIDGILRAMAEACHAHQLEDHRDTFDQPVTYRGMPLETGDGKPANGGMVGESLPRWWDWITVKGTR